jgi:hypothetical protein
MAVMAAALLVGCIGGWATGGSIARLACLRVRAWPALLAALGLEACLGATSGPLRPTIAVTACLAVACWCAANSRRGQLCYGPGLIGSGVVLNATVMALNGGMPVSAAALAAAGFPRSLDVAQGHLYKHVAMTSHSRLGLLGDVLPFHLARMVLSPGDLLMLAGIAAIAWGATRPPRGAGCSTGQIDQSNVASTREGPSRPAPANGSPCGLRNRRDRPLERAHARAPRRTHRCK